MTRRVARLMIMTPVRNFPSPLHHQVQWPPLHKDQQRQRRTRVCSHGSRNSELLANLRAQQQLTSSRPKTIDDVSSQENTVNVLRKALMSTNVSCRFLNVIQITNDLASAYALLRPSRYRQNEYVKRRSNIQGRADQKARSSPSLDSCSALTYSAPVCWS
jgi:hypothetical protein